MEWIIGLILAIVSANLGIPVLLYRWSMQKIRDIENNMTTMRSNDLQHIDEKLTHITDKMDRNYKDLNTKLFQVVKDK